VSEIPYGDPGAMRAFAFDLNLAANKLGSLAETTVADAVGVAWDGPAAIEFHGNVQEIGGGAKTVAGRLQALVGYLLQQATTLEEAQNEARRRIAAEEEMNREKERHLSP
jgi:uncharacterized protein YukE